MASLPALPCLFYLSHAREDGGWEVEKVFYDIEKGLCKALGLPESSIGFRDRRTIEQGTWNSTEVSLAIEFKPIVVALMSPSYLGSLWCRWERALSPYIAYIWKPYGSREPAISSWEGPPVSPEAAGLYFQLGLEGLISSGQEAAYRELLASIVQRLKELIPAPPVVPDQLGSEGSMMPAAPPAPPYLAGSLPPTTLEMLADVPLDDESADLLGFRTYLDALVGLIDDPATGTPLTLAINGPWGAGKSTLGRMIQRRLESKPARNGHSPHVTCWFNAWMHDEAPDLASAFAAQVALSTHQARSFWSRFFQPIPTGFLSSAKRLQRRGMRFVLLAASAFSVVLWLMKHVGSAGLPLGEQDFKLMEVISVAGLHPQSGLAFFLSAAVITIVLIQTVRPMAQEVLDFVLDPKATAAGAGMDRVRAQLFRLIDKATPPGSRFVVYVDDLERCRPPRAVEVLEVINQLLSHPSVVTVIMADMPAVAACVEVKYEKLAEIYKPGTEISLRSERTGSYGRLYLQKIVQLQFDLPVQTRSSITSLLKKVAQRRVVEESVSSATLDSKLWEDCWALAGRPIEFWNRLRNCRDGVRRIACGFIYFLLWPVTGPADVVKQSFFRSSMRWIGKTREASRLRAWARALIVVTFALSLVFVSFEGLLATVLVSVVLAVADGWAERDHERTWIRRIRSELEARPTVEELREAHLEPAHEAFRQERHYQILVNDSEFFTVAQEEALKYLPLLPRSAKRLLNNLRLLTYVAYEKRLLEGETKIDARHLGQWVVLRERWPEVAQILSADPSRMAQIESSAQGANGQEQDERMRTYLEGEPELRNLCREDGGLAGVVSRLVSLGQI